MITYQVKCKACNVLFMLKDGKECKHQIKLKIGSTECPNCGHCLCKGKTYDEINAHFMKKRNAGRHVMINAMMWVHKDAVPVQFGDEK